MEDRNRFDEVLNLITSDYSLALPLLPLNTLRLRMILPALALSARKIAFALRKSKKDIY